jgi:hypothetical protein
LPPEFERLSNHPEAVIALRDSSAKEAIASHPSTSVAVLEALAGTNDDRVLAAVAGNPSTPVPVLEALALDSRYSMWAARRAVAGNPSTPAAVLESLSCDTSPGIRSGVAESLSAPTAVLARLAGDLESAVRGSVARNPSTPADVLERLSKDTDSSVRGAVATNPSSTETVLSVLAGDSDWQVPMLVALNPSVSVDLRERYLQAWADRIQRALQREISIRESGASSSQVSILPADLVRATTWLGLIDPDPDNKALTKASRSKDWLARLSVALHPQSTEGILRLLAKDADADVAAAARLPRSSLGTMAATPSSATAATASGHPVSALPDEARTTGEAVLAAPAGAPLPDPVTPAKIEVSVTQSDPSEQIPAEPTQNLGASTLSASRKICISGKLPSGKKKADYEAPLRAAGFELVDEVVKGLAYLVLADPQLTTSKSGKARKLGIPVISEADLAKLVG